MNGYTAQAGDIFACYGADWLSRFISLQTVNPLSPRGLRLGPSHVAIAAQVTGEVDCHWVESTSLARRACFVRNEVVRGCQVHPIGERVSDYVDAGGSVEVYRLHPINELVPGSAIELARDLRWFVRQGVGYDFASAIFSGTHILRVTDALLSFWRPAADSVFCSQLLAAELQSLGLMNRQQPQRYTPGRLVRELVAQGVYFRAGSLAVRKSNLCLSLES